MNTIAAGAMPTRWNCSIISTNATAYPTAPTGVEPPIGIAYGAAPAAVRSSVTASRAISSSPQWLSSAPV